MGDGCLADAAALRKKTEEALRADASQTELQTMLARLVEVADEGSDDFIFAHKHLAEFHIESAPWQAALHLRQALRFNERDDVLNALNGLCQALLGNYRSSVAAYRRALSLASRNPWYHHNLGHLLDIALNQPATALAHLRLAHVLEPGEAEITASLAHCLGRLQGPDRLHKLDEARLLAEEAAQGAPENVDHQALVQWIAEGALPESDPNGWSLPADVAADARVDPDAASTLDERVVRMTEEQMVRAGCSAEQRCIARALWVEFRKCNVLGRVTKPESYAAALEYATARVQELSGVTQTSVAKRYGIAPTSLASRFTQIRDTLRLRPGDPRFCLADGG